MAWMDGPARGRRRVRMTPRQAILTRHELETRATRVTAERIIADPLLQIDELLDGRGIEATIVGANHARRVVKPGNVRASAEPELVLRTGMPCPVPVGDTLNWTQDPRVGVELVDITADGDGSLVTVRVVTGATFAAGLTRGAVGTFTIHNLATYGFRPLPANDPFTHVAADLTGPAHLEVVS